MSFGTWIKQVATLLDKYCGCTIVIGTDEKGGMTPKFFNYFHKAYMNKRTPKQAVDEWGKN